MNATELKSTCAARGLRGLLLLGCLLWFYRPATAGTITNVAVVNVTPSSFSVVWRDTNTTPSIAVFADAGGVTNLAGQVGIEAFPLRTGNPDSPAGYQRRLDAAALQRRAQNFGLMMMRVSDCQPATTYYFRLTTTFTNGSQHSYPVSGPLPAATTATENTFVTNDQMFIFDTADPSQEGNIVLLTNADAAYPLAAVVGDGVGISQVFFNLNDFVTLAGTGNISPVGEENFTMRFLAPNPLGQTQTFALTFSADFTAALGTLLSASGELLGVQAGTAVLRAGQSGSVPLAGEVNTNLSSIDLTLQIPTGHLTNLVLQSLAPQLDPAASTFVQQNNSVWQMHLAVLSGQTIVGSNTLAAIAFTAISNQTSAFVPIQLTQLAGTKTDARAISRTLAQSGQVVVIANQPLLAAGFGADGSRQLTLYGKAWMSYAIEFTTNLLDPSGWNQLWYFAQTNMVTTFNPPGSPAPNAFYRAMEFTPDPPVLNALLGAGQTRTLLGYGQAGSNYTVFAKTNLSNVVPWTPVQTYTLTNPFIYLNASGSSPIIFYRLQRN